MVASTDAKAKDHLGVQDIVLGRVVPIAFKEGKALGPSDRGKRDARTNESHYC